LAEGASVFIYIFLLAIVILLAAILSAMKFGFNQVVTGLQAVHAELRKQALGRSSGGDRDGS
jgi:hypothetical protein